MIGADIFFHAMPRPEGLSVPHVVDSCTRHIPPLVTPQSQISSETTADDVNLDADHIHVSNFDISVEHRLSSARVVELHSTDHRIERLQLPIMSAQKGGHLEAMTAESANKVSKRKSAPKEDEDDSGSDADSDVVRSSPGTLVSILISE